MTISTFDDTIVEDSMKLLVSSDDALVRLASVVLYATYNRVDDGVSMMYEDVLITELYSVLLTLLLNTSVEREVKAIGVVTALRLSSIDRSPTVLLPVDCTDEERDREEV